MRIQVAKAAIRSFLMEIRRVSGVTFRSLSEDIGIHPRTLRDWSRGRYAPKYETLQILSDFYRVRLPVPKRYLDDYWYAAKAGKKGGRTIIEKYGKVNGSPNITPEMRSRAAKKAMETRIKRGDRFYSSLKIVRPKASEKLAECIGIILGDGGITPRQVYITLHKKDDVEFARYVLEVFRRLFSLEASVEEREMTKKILFSRTQLVHYLQEIGLRVGHKVRQQVDVPGWIKQNRNYTKACLRGLFDTDGCFYVDRHRYKGKTYYHCALNFTNRSLPLLNFFKATLEQVGLHPTQTTRYSIAVRRENEIIEYFHGIGTSNPKHLNKFNRFFHQKYGGVPKRS